MTNHTTAPTAERVTKLIAKRSFCTLATVSPAGWPHDAAVLYEQVDTTMYVSTSRASRKARNVEANRHVAVCIPIRRLPVGPPSSVQFQAAAEVLALDDPEITRLVQGGRLKSITSHGELDDPDNCFLRITPGRTAHTYGLGMSLWRLIRDPLHAAGRVELNGRR
jgi:general stress protein 26